ncbi:hypothetical protein [Bacteroides ihuae]|uniref:hypothetical protein n=1 Tax=Bacteroides ihuae TaxID=1852362 RepID=UPI0008D9166F|nr:hypothetical protein [Bacteroides ihuae]
MKKSIIKTQREIVETLIHEHLSLSYKCDELEKLGVNVNLSNILLDTAFDIIGFPQDTTIETNASDKDYFCRDYLTNSTIIDRGSSNQHQTVEDYVEYLYNEMDNLEKESPELFQLK